MSIRERLIAASQRGAQNNMTYDNLEFNILIKRIEEFAHNTGEREYIYYTSNWGGMSSELLTRLGVENITVTLIRSKRDHDTYRISW